MRTKYIFNVLIVSILASMILSGCRPAPTKRPNPTQKTQPAPTQTATQAGLPTPTIPAPSEAITPASTHEPSTVQLGSSFWIGRGMIRKAVFLAGTKQVAIAWANGVSLNNVADGSEEWFQPAPANVRAFDVQPQGNEFAAYLADGRVMLLAAKDGKAQLVNESKADIAYGDIAWSPDGQRLAYQYLDSGNLSSPAYVLQIASGAIIQIPGSQLVPGTRPVLVWSPDGSAISLAALNETCPRFADIQTGETRMVLGETGACYWLPPMAILNDGKIAGVRWGSNAIDIISYPDGKLEKALSVNPADVTGWIWEAPNASSSLFSEAGGHWLASRGGYSPCYCDNPQAESLHPLIVWDLQSGAELSRLSQFLPGLEMRFRIAATFNGDSILVMYESGEITRWEFTKPGSVEQVVATIPARPPDPLSLAWSLDGSRLAFASTYGGVEVYQVASQHLIARFEPPMKSPSLSPDGSLVALYDPEHQTELVYQAESRKLVRAWPATPVLMGAEFSPDGKSLAFGQGSTAWVAALDTGEMTILDPTKAVPATQGMTPARFVWSPDGQALVTLYGPKDDNQDAGVIVLWKRVEDGAFKYMYHVYNTKANYTTPETILATFNPSGSRVALESMPSYEAGEIYLFIYDLAEGSVGRSFPEYEPCAWVNDEVLLASEAASWRYLTRINVVDGHKDVGSGTEVGGNVYAPGGIFYAQAYAAPGSISIKHWHGGALVAFTAREPVNLFAPSWSPDGHWLAAFGDDGTLEVWWVTVR